MYRVVISPSADADLFGNYLIIYRIVEEESVVRVVHIFHAMQNYIEHLKNEI